MSKSFFFRVSTDLSVVRSLLFSEAPKRTVSSISTSAPETMSNRKAAGQPRLLGPVRLHFFFLSFFLSHLVTILDFFFRHPSVRPSVLAGLKAIYNRLALFLRNRIKIFLKRLSPSFPPSTVQLAYSRGLVVVADTAVVVVSPIDGRQ